MPTEGEINSRKVRSSRYVTRIDGEGLVNPTSGEISLNEHFIGVNLRLDMSEVESTKG